MTSLKPYRLVPIEDCGEPLVAIPLALFPVMNPHPYQMLGAPYGEKSPFFVREGVRDRLITAQHWLQHQRPDWKILIFDAFRPLSVQQFMVDYTFTQLLQQQGLELTALTPFQRQQMLEQVYEFWALPDPDPTRPPPHSTGGAIDVTLVDDQGQVVEMGGAIDEMSPRSYPNHYATRSDPAAKLFHRQRELLHQAMTQAGFLQHPNEWWHFCYGDQLWAWLRQQQDRDRPLVAQYGRVAEECEEGEGDRREGQ